MTSFKQMIQAGDIKRKDIFRVNPQDIHAQQGFNARRETPALKASIDALADFIIGGGKIPPLEVQPRDEGGVWLTDGHRRHRAILQAIECGAVIEWVDAVPFDGDERQRAVRIHTSQNGEPLAVLDAALHYAHLATEFGMSADDIAKEVGKSRQHVDQGLILASAPDAIHHAIDAGKISPAEAVKMVREHGDKAAEVLDRELEGAAAVGKKKVTAGTIKGKALPPKVIGPLVEAADKLVEGLTEREHSELVSLRNGSTATNGTIMVHGAALLALLDAHTAILDARADQKRRAKDKAARAKQKALEAA